MLAPQHLNTLHVFVNHLPTHQIIKSWTLLEKLKISWLNSSDPWNYRVGTWPRCWQWEIGTPGLLLDAGGVEKLQLRGLCPGESGSSDTQFPDTAECHSGTRKLCLLSVVHVVEPAPSSCGSGVFVRPALWYVILGIGQASMPSSPRDFVSYSMHFYSIHFLLILVRGVFRCLQLIDGLEIPGSILNFKDSQHSVLLQPVSWNAFRMNFPLPCIIVTLF